MSTEQNEFDQNPGQALAVFEALLTSYPFHPILWTLYSVNQSLAIRKPAMEKSMEILTRSKSPGLVL
jgi:hypothetical protein